ncbi:MAG: RHS repeat-associated core domain-containing protein [Verrucomicrobia bacterium]|nr:RHS repeat-associated core domain-containing protein [Verrucomicrobiota bacterium]
MAGGNTRHYYYSSRWQVLEERLNALTTADRQFVWGIRHVDDLVERDRSSERFYVLHDHLSVTAIINTTGAVQERYGYDGFGPQRVMDASFGARASSLYDWETGFAAYRLDTESGLYQVRHRCYHPKLGRWIARDPIVQLSDLNLYCHVGNKLLNDVDPSGTLSRKECLAKLKSLKTHLKEVQDHFSPGHCNSIRCIIELFEGSQCKQWAGSLDKELNEVIDIFNRFCRPGLKERKFPIPKICDRCVEATPSNVGKWIAVGGLCAAGAAIIIFDIVTIPSGEGACGAVLIRYACSL